MAGADGVNTHRFLFYFYLLMKLAIFCPVQARAVMVLGVIAVAKPQPVIEFIIAAHAPSHRHVGVGVRRGFRPAVEGP